MNRIGGVGIAWYRKEDYERVRAISNDAHTFPIPSRTGRSVPRKGGKKFSSWDTSSSRHTSTQIHSPPGAAPTDTKSTPKDVWHSHPPRRIGSRRTCTRTDIDITRRLLPLCQLGPDAGPIVTQGLTADLPGGAPKASRSCPAKRHALCGASAIGGSTQSTKRYAHLATDSLRDALVRIGATKRPAQKSPPPKQNGPRIAPRPACLLGRPPRVELGTNGL